MCLSYELDRLNEELTDADRRIAAMQAQLEEARQELRKVYHRVEQDVERNDLIEISKGLSTLQSDQDFTAYRVKGAQRRAGYIRQEAQTEALADERRA